MDGRGINIERILRLAEKGKIRPSASDIAGMIVSGTIGTFAGVFLMMMGIYIFQSESRFWGSLVILLGLFFIYMLVDSFILKWRYKVYKTAIPAEFIIKEIIDSSEYFLLEPVCVRKDILIMEISKPGMVYERIIIIPHENKVLINSTISPWNMRWFLQGIWRNNTNIKIIEELIETAEEDYEMIKHTITKEQIIKQYNL